VVHLVLSSGASKNYTAGKVFDERGSVHSFYASYAWWLWWRGGGEDEGSVMSV